MKQRIFCLFFLMLPVLFTQLNAQPHSFDKAAFYKIMQDGNVETIDKQLKIIIVLPNINRDAYAGALLMKKAGLIKGASKKLNVFKDGHTKLEAAIEKEKDNAEWHFLRLIIQENAPRMLGYKSDKKEDAAIVHNSFKNLSPEVQSAVTDYRKRSTTLQTLNF